jgi:inhibitor of KinA
MGSEIFAPSMPHAARFFPASDQSLLVYLGERVSPEIHERVAKLLHLLEAAPIPGVRNLHPAYCSVLVKFDPLMLDHARLETILRGYLERLPRLSLGRPREVEIPVCYGGKCGEDLESVAESLGISAERVIALHTSVTYRVYVLGFVPGFAYLGELPTELAVARLSSPRRSVPAGSVGIAGHQTAVYPFATPGGWRLIGRTPISMFRPERAQMSAVALGDWVRFVAVSQERFAELAAR